MTKSIMAFVGLLFCSSVGAVQSPADKDVDVIELQAFCMDLPVMGQFLKEWKEIPMMTGDAAVRYKGKDVDGRFILFVNPKSWQYTSVIKLKDKWCVTGIGTNLKPAKPADNKE